MSALDHKRTFARRPLYPQERTFSLRMVMSAEFQKQTSVPQHIYLRTGD